MKTTLSVLLSVLALTACATNNSRQILSIAEQGSFAAGGTVIRAAGQYNPADVHNPQGQTLHGDHLYVSYQRPLDARQYPLTFLHGAGQSAKTWESTPDGREGFQNIFLRRNFTVYLIDQPRRGKAGRATIDAEIKAKPDDQMWFQQFRVGVFPDYYQGVQFPRDAESLEQYFRQMTPNTADFNLTVIADAVAALYRKTGAGVLVTHSQGGGVGWASAMKSPEIKAIASYEPGSNFPFPEGEVPDPIANKFSGALAAYGVPAAEFQKLTRIPILIVYGDYIPKTPSDNPSQDYWRAASQMAAKWAEVVNRHGGDVTLVHLPDAGIKGNTHFPFSDLNNIEVADHLSAWLKKYELD